MTTYQAQARRLTEREREIRKATRKLDADTLAVVVQRVAQDTGADRRQLGDAAGLGREHR